MSQDNPFAVTTEKSIVSEQLQKAKVVGLSADAIEAAFAPMVNMLRIIESDFDKIITKNINPETIIEAKELRMRMVKIRTGTDKIHKEQKEEFLVKGRAVDAIKNVLTAAVYDKEKKLSEIENHFINIEKEAKMKLFTERKALLEPLIGPLASTFPLGELDKDSFTNMLNGYRLAAEEKQKAAEREAQEKAEAEQKKSDEEKRIREDNEKLKKLNIRIIRLSKLGFQFNSETDEYIHEGSGTSVVHQNVERYVDPQFDSLMTALEKEVNAYNKEVEKKRLEDEEKLRKERAERKKLEDELAAKAAQEESERKAKLAAERKAKRAPDKEKLMTIVSAILAIDYPECKDPDAIKIMNGAQELLAKTVTYITNNTDKL